MVYFGYWKTQQKLLLDISQKKSTEFITEKNFVSNQSIHMYKKM